MSSLRKAGLLLSLVMVMSTGRNTIAPSEFPLTRAERTDYRETSHYSDVIAFLERLQSLGAPMAVQYIGTSEGGRRMPLVMVSRPPVATPAEARRSGKVVVYVQANIHGGEVEGKEAVLMLLRQLTEPDRAANVSERGQLLDRLVLLVTPIYNIDGNEKFGDARAWVTFGEEPRYVTNYVGLRNRVSVLSEAVSFLPFKVRVETALRFVEGVLDEVAKNAPRILRLTREADERVVRWGLQPASAPALGVRFEPASRGVEQVPVEKLQPHEPVDHRRAPKNLENLSLPIYDRFRPTRTAKFPAAYLIPPAHANVVELLRRHGVVVERLKMDWQGMIEEFVVEELVTAPTPFQGHRLNRLEGRFEAANANVPAGTYLVRTAQPLGILIFHLLEPESLDGVAAWNFLDGALKVKERYPIRKTFAQVHAPTEREP